jgi:hypothetical protein
MLGFSYKVSWLFVDVESTFIGFLDTENHIVDTKINFLRHVVPEILTLDHFGHVTLTHYVPFRLLDLDGNGHVDLFHHKNRTYDKKISKRRPNTMLETWPSFARSLQGQGSKSRRRHYFSRIPWPKLSRKRHQHHFFLMCGSWDRWTKSLQILTYVT